MQTIAEFASMEYNGRYFEMFAVVCEAEIVGFVSLYEHDAATISLGPEIMEKHWRNGYGTQAMELGLLHAKQKGYTKATAQIRKNNAASIKLHEKLGYQKTGEMVNRKGTEVFVYERKLENASERTATMHIHGEKIFPYGYNPIATIGDTQQNSLMDFGLLRMRAGETFQEAQELERAYLLISGRALVEWGCEKQTVQRKNCFDESPTVLHVPRGVSVTLTAQTECEWTVHRTENLRDFAPRLYLPEETPDEHRGAGTMRETSTRIVRTVFDHSNAPQANLVLGEVIGFPGKWSSYPPHYHSQPEIYFYRFNPENGFGYAELGEEVIKTHQNSTVFITKEETHPQTTAPGYAMWYLWVIRHLPGDPYITPTFVPEHLWVTQPDADIWPCE